MTVQRVSRSVRTGQSLLKFTFVPQKCCQLSWKVSKPFKYRIPTLKSQLVFYSLHDEKKKRKGKP